MGCGTSRNLNIVVDAHLTSQSKKCTLPSTESAALSQSSSTSVHPSEIDQVEQYTRYTYLEADVSAPQPATKFREVEDLELMGVSVYYLNNTFMDEVKAAGFSGNSPVHEIEPVVIRGKGHNRNCPRDHRRGTSYIDAIENKSMVGRSTHMLSYTWGYKIGEIVETLKSYCTTKGKNPRTTFIWICCLCINQHRVRELADQKEMIDPVEFFGSFGSRVTTIGHMLSMMSPWDNPRYVTRVWCCFEMHTALQNDAVTFEIIMPPQETESLRATLCDNFEKIIRVISYVDVYESKATVEADRKQIFDYIRGQHGGFRKFNNDVIAALRAWLLDTTDAQLHVALNMTEQEKAAKDRLTMGAAQLNHDLGDDQHAVKLYREVLKYREEYLAGLPEDSEEFITALQAKGHVLNRLAHLLHGRTSANGSAKSYQQSIDNVEGMYRESLLLYEAALASLKKSILPFGETDDEEAEGLRKIQEATAGALNNLAHFLKGEGRLQESQPLYKKSRVFYEYLNPNGLEMASILNNIAQVDRALGSLFSAEEGIRKSLAITESLVGKDHTAVATKVSNLAEILEEKAWDLQPQEANKVRLEAGKLYYRSLRIVEKTLGKSHPQVAEALSNLASNLQIQGPKQLQKAEAMYRQSLVIEKAALGEKTVGVANTLQNLGTCLQMQEKYSEAAYCFEDCLLIKEITHKNDLASIGGTQYSLATVEFVIRLKCLCWGISLLIFRFQARNKFKVAIKYGEKALGTLRRSNVTIAKTRIKMVETFLDNVRARNIQNNGLRSSSIKSTSPRAMR